jgi:hypothetical protein
MSMTVIKKPKPTALRRPAVSQYLREKFQLVYTPGSLATLASYGQGPPYFRAGRFVLYPIHLIDEWAEQRLAPTVDSDSELLPRR